LACCGLNYLVDGLGVLTAIYLAFRLVRFLLTYVILPNGKYNPKKYGAGQGSWALITGSSDGIGKGFAEELAKDGFNLFLVSRTESKLKALVESLTREYKIEAKYLALDLSKGVKESLHLIKPHLEGLEGKLGMLVNNVGVNTDIPVKFEEMPQEDILYLIDVNVTFTLLLTQAAIPILKKNNHGRSAIINLSSITAAFPSAPYLSVYGATKAFVQLWSKSLSTELAGSNVDNLAVSPAYVASAMSGFKKGSLIVTLPNATARDSLRKLGSYDEATPSLIHSVQRFLMADVCPPAIMNPFLSSQLAANRQKMLHKKKAT